MGEDPGEDPARADLDALLALHEQDRRAHLTGDADLLVSGMADHVWEAGRGQLTRHSHAEMLDRFESYFAQVRYSIWDDLQPPHVAISDDGRHAWMTGHIEARLAPTEDPNDVRAFDSAWIATYEKMDGRWLMVGISSSIVDRS